MLVTVTYSTALMMKVVYGGFFLKYVRELMLSGDKNLQINYSKEAKCLLWRQEGNV